MSTRPRAPRIVRVAGILALVVGLLGFIAAIFMNSFVLDRYTAYGEVPIPGTGTVALPKGEVIISFHARVTGGKGSSLPVPPLTMDLVPPDGVEDPHVTENMGSSTTINNDAHVRVWVAQIATAGTYTVTTKGDVNGYIRPRLAFGNNTASALWPVTFGVLFGVGLVMTVLAGFWRGRASKTPKFAAPPPIETGTYSSHFPTDDGVRIEQLKTLAALHESGALTNSEFEAEKRRVLGGG
ncbi:SHOCT domain-containing protein [Mycobacteroides franklinii]|uniref:SHOCT domain-containing protein n=1 Tax=Mycobacteroides franklinii TaxID=948102 RepID=UPI000993B400|nr:SHOCT domain-containing protein [Mycobacteroides franklinii]